MSRINTFISYAQEDKETAGEVNRCLINSFGFNSFIAHDDIYVSAEFEPTIIEKIKNCDFFIAFISDNFKQSVYANQEVGMAIAWDKRIIPIKLDNINPCGFIAKYQALPFKKEYYEPVFYMCNKIFFLSFLDPRYTSYKEKVLSSIVYALKHSNEFSITKGIMRVMSKIRGFNQEHLQEIAEIINSNRVARDEKYALPSLKEYFKKQYDFDIDMYNESNWW